MNNELENKMMKSMSKMEEAIKDELKDIVFDKYSEDLPEKIGEEDLKGINEGLAYLSIFKTMLKDWAALEDKRYEEMSKKLDRILSKIDTLKITTESIDGTLDTVLELQRKK